MPLNKNIHKVMVIGSGPIVIGQAAEFDYAGTQACKALKEQGLEVVLVNSNPATLMTDHSMADAIYIEPLIPETIQRIIEKEKPDSLLNTFVERLFGSFQQLPDILIDFSNTECIARISVESVKDCSTIDRDDVAFL